jgi:hypothetical protein
MLFMQLDRLLQNLTKPVIVTGAGVPIRVKKGVSAGADFFAEQWAMARRHTLVRFHAEWEKYGKKAGPLRNAEMVAFAGQRRPAFLVAFWDGKSPGTADCIAWARKAKFKVIVVNY